MATTMGLTPVQIRQVDAEVARRLQGQKFPGCSCGFDPLRDGGHAPECARLLSEDNEYDREFEAVRDAWDW